MTERRRVMVVTGSRAEYGLLRPVMRSVALCPSLELIVIAAGSHLVSPAETLRDVKADFTIADVVPMQIAGRIGRVEDAESVSRGVGRFNRVFERHDPHWIVVLGDRIEPFAATIAASVGGRAVAHIHGGDRAEGVADESMRHAITKLAHLHLAATPMSADRIIRMGEDPARVRVVGSPAIDELADIPALDDERYVALGSPRTVLLLHPTGRPDGEELDNAAAIWNLVASRSVLWLEPNHDPGRTGIVNALRASGADSRAHLPRSVFVGLLKRLAAMGGPDGGLIIGNSSAGLIEAAAIGLPAVDIGTRQSGRELGGNVIRSGISGLAEAIQRALVLDRRSITHPFGDGRTGALVADALAGIDPAAPGMLRKLCTY